MSSEMKEWDKIKNMDFTFQYSPEIKRCHENVDLSQQQQQHQQQLQVDGEILMDTQTLSATMVNNSKFNSQFSQQQHNNNNYQASYTIREFTASIHNTNHTIQNNNQFSEFSQQNIYLTNQTNNNNNNNINYGVGCFGIYSSQSNQSPIAQNTIEAFLSTNNEMIKKEEDEKIRNHSLQNYLKLRSLKGDDIQIDFNEFDDEDNMSDNRSTQLQTRLGSPEKITINEIDENNEDNDEEEQKNERMLQRANTMPTPTNNNGCFMDLEMQTSSNINNNQEYGIKCRICKIECSKQQQENVSKQIINPCQCQGIYYWVHINCLENEIRCKLEYYKSNPNQKISCSRCKIPYQLNLSQKLHRGRLIEFIPCFIFLFTLLALVIYFLIKFITDVQNQNNSTSLNNALVNLYIFVAILFLKIIFTYLTIKSLQKQYLKIQSYQTISQRNKNNNNGGSVLDNKNNNKNEQINRYRKTDEQKHRDNIIKYLSSTQSDYCQQQ